MVFYPGLQNTGKEQVKGWDQCVAHNVWKSWKISNSTLYKYLRNIFLNAAFTTLVVQVLIEERQKAHRQWWNKGKIQPTFKIGDAVKAYVQVQPNAYQGEVKNSHIKHKPMNTELYNETYLSSKIQHPFTSNSHDKYSAFINTIAYKPHKNTPTMTPAEEIFHESGNPIPTINSIEATTIKQHSSHIINFNISLHKKILLIQYTPDGIMQHR